LWFALILVVRHYRQLNGYMQFDGDRSE